MKRRNFIKQTVVGAAFTTIGGSLCSSAVTSADDPKNLLASAGTTSACSGTFTRRFPRLPKQGLGNPRLEEGLSALADKMIQCGEETISEPMPPLAGYTYLGQLIDHDLTLDLTSLKDAKPDVARTPNFRTPFLDLDHVYGGGPNLSPFLYQAKHEYRRAERFLIGKTITPDGGEGSDNDLPRNAEGIALVGDPRQDENLILAQLHVVFLKLHNKVLERSNELKKSPYYEQAGSPFAAAQRLVKWHYQWIVRHDFLKQILDRNLFDHLAHAETPDASGKFQIPVEFSVAAFRFGHSMVRNKYAINDNHLRVDLGDLLKFTGPGTGARPRLPEGMKVDWKYFFVILTEGMAQKAEVVDTRITPGLYNITPNTQKLFSVPTEEKVEPRLPARTLLRGARVALPSGQRIAAKLGCEVLHGPKIAVGAGPEEAKILSEYNFLEDTPLWYYVLKEAEVLGKDRHLGQMGSRLVADVVMSALTKDPDSYLSVAQKPRWTPTLPTRIPNRPESFDMSDLVRFVG
jgi:hypothetical protein